MNNRKTIFIAMLCLLVFTLFFSACEKDSPTKPKEEVTLVGTWKVSKMSWTSSSESGTYTESQLDSMGLVLTYKLKEDSTMELITNIDGPLMTLTGTWSTSGNQLTMTSKGPNGEIGTLVNEYAIDGNILKLNWQISAGTKYYAEFTKQN